MTPEPFLAVTHRLLVAEDAAGRLDVWLAAQLPDLSRSRLQALIAEGRITIDGRPARASGRPHPGQMVEVTVPAPTPAVPQPQALALDILYEDEALLILNKPAGLVVHPAPGHADGTLVNGLLYHCDDLGGVGGVARPGIVHRLDKETSGLMVVAKHDAALNALAAQFQAGGVRKEYLALVHGAPPREAGTIDAPIGRHPVQRQRMRVAPQGGRKSVSHYRIEERFASVTLLRVRIETGRTHQIRVHLAHLGLPVAGDPVYGRPGRDRLLPDCPPRQMLHAATLALAHPVDGRPLAFSCPPPADMLALLARLRAPRGENA